MEINEKFLRNNDENNPVKALDIIYQGLPEDREKLYIHIAKLIMNRGDEDLLDHGHYFKPIDYALQRWELSTQIAECIERYDLALRKLNYIKNKLYIVNPKTPLEELLPKNLKELAKKLESQKYKENIKEGDINKTDIPFMDQKDNNSFDLIGENAEIP